MKKSTRSTLILVLLLLTGLSLLLYPSFSDYWNSIHQTRAIANYTEQVSVLDPDRYDDLWAEAKAYNQSLLTRENVYTLTDEQKAIYERQLDPTGSGIMAYIEIPAIQCHLPIYHGTDEAVLQVAIGHLDWTSLPTGGAGTHTVVSGHRGLPSAKLFTELDRLVLGDVFMLHVLDETLTYQVDQILIVEPHETEALLVQEDMDLCTLVTCTPYGVNTHRLLVRGHRVDNAAPVSTVRVTADAIQIEPLLVALVLLAFILLILMLLLLFGGWGRSSKRKRTIHKEVAQ